MIIKYNGQDILITNWDEFKDSLLNNIGVQVALGIKRQIADMKLQDSGAYKNSIKWEVKNGELILSSSVEYAQYLEYGTFAYWQSYGLSSFPEKLDPKKKDISRKAAKELPKGMSPFAPFRRVLYNQNKMSKIIDKAVKHA